MKDTTNNQSAEAPLSEVSAIGTNEVQAVTLSQYSHGAGCGCKIAPQVLEQILQSNIQFPNNKKLLVGNSSKDDAAVYDLDNGTALVSTTDFFMPIVDDAFDFGKIASANAISDVYAMGGKPLMAIAILGWPVEKLPTELAQKVLEGAREICLQAGIPLAGGHSIDSTEPIFGLAVTGIVDVKNLKQNNTAQQGNYLFLTKPIGVGILATAQKRGLLSIELLQTLTIQLTTLNSIGEQLGKIDGVTAMTDVTGFGLLGHLIEMAEGSNLSAELYYNKLKVINGATDFLKQRVVPDATYRNWNSYSSKVSFDKGVNVMEAFNLLPDPQTNGGLLIAVKEDSVEEVQNLFTQKGLQNFIEPVGRIIKKGEKTVVLRE
jgi:selenide, water dikinase